MKWIILFFSFFVVAPIHAITTDDPPRLRSTVGVLLPKDIQFSTGIVTFAPLTISSSSRLAVPLRHFFTPLSANNMQQYRAWSYEELAFFCKIEVQLEKVAKIPVKFRLGEVQYVERLEGKYD